MGCGLGGRHWDPSGRPSQCPPTLSLPHTWDPEQRGWGASHSPIWWNLDQGAQQVLRRASEGSRTRRPPRRGRWEIRVSGRTPPGAPCEGGSQSHRREGGGPGQPLARPGRTQSPSPPALDLPRATVCAVRAMTGQTPPVPGHLPVDSRGRWAGTRLRREPRFPRRDGDGHPSRRGLPRTEAVCQPLVGEQACGRQDRQVAGGRGAGLAWPPTPLAGGRGPGSCRAPPGHLHVTEPCLLTPVPACPAPGPSPPWWKYGWIVTGTTFVSSQHFPPI